MAANEQNPTQRATQLRIHLKTRHSDIELPQDTGSVLVSTEFRRYQLSTLVNRLLEAEKPVPLEFIVNGQFLRTSLDEYLAENGISAETILNVEYIKALVPPVHVANYQHDEWLSSVDVLSNTSDAVQWSKDVGNVQSRILTGSYDSLVRVWNMSSEVVATGHGHDGYVKSVKFVSPNRVISSGQDRTLRLWDYVDPGVGPASLTPWLELYGHKMSVDSVAVHAPSSKALTASADHGVGLWSLKKSDAPAAPENLLPTANKRRKLSKSASSVQQRGYLSMLRGHQAQVMDVCFDQKDATVAYSASQDHSVKTWDLATGTAVDSKTTEVALYSVCHLPEQSLVATGGFYGQKIWLLDPRASASRISVMTLSGHRKAVSSLARDPSSSHRIVSASHDSTCRIWDIRSAQQDVDSERVSKSIYVIERESQKGKPKPEEGDESRVFSVCWDEEVGIVSGGRDGMAQINKAPVE